MNDRRPSDSEVGFLEPDQASLWDAFVETCPEATFFHRAGWKHVIEQSFGHRCYYLYVMDAGRINGVLPLTHIKSKLFGNALISNAFCVYGGPISNGRNICAKLMQSAVQLGRSLKVDYLEFRSRDRATPEWPSNSDLYVTFRRQLDTDQQKNFLAIPKRQRAEVRRAAQFGLSCEVDDGVDRFYGVYAQSMRNLGTPVHSINYFKILNAEFGSDCEIITASHEDKAVSSLFTFYFREEAHPYYIGYTNIARELRANHFICWEAMRRACERNCRVFDFGRSKRGTGSFFFKKNWGFEPRPLHYEYKLLRRAELPMVNPLNPKFTALISVWKRLPIPLANFVGPFVARNLG